MSFLNNKNKVSDLYYNINVVNKENRAIALRYNDSRGSILLDNVDNYNLSILRFSVNLDETPVMIFPTDVFDTFQDGPLGYPDNVAYYITIRDGAGFYRDEPITYDARGRTSPYIYNFQHFCDMLNVAVRNACDNLGINLRVPYFEFNKATASIDFICPAEYDESVVGHYNVYCNTALYNLFMKDYNGEIAVGTLPNIPDTRYYRINCGGTGSNAITTERVQANGMLINAGAWPGYRMTTYYPNLGGMCACVGLVFTTAQLPILSEYTSDDLDLSNDTSNSFTKILKDFELDLQDGNSIHTRGIQNFNISSEFQMTQLKSGGESLKYIDLQAFWRDRHGRLHELLLPPGSSFSMKLLFRLK